MLAGILIDTANLQDQAKTQLLDMTTVRRLYEGCPKGSLPPQDGFYKGLAADKFNPEYWGQVPPKELLRADYKQYSEGGMVYGISSVLVGLERLAATAEAGRELGDALATHGTTRGLDMLMMMSFTTEPKPRRQLLLHCGNERLAAALAHYLEGIDELDLQPLAAAGLPAEALLYEQRGLAASRKKVAPILQAFFTLPYAENPYVKKGKL